MIFIAGVSPKTTVLDQTARLCPECGLAQARRQRVDHYLSLFFIPLFRVKKGEEFLFCNRCDRPVSEISAGSPSEPHQSDSQCALCGQHLEKDHHFCPYCGHPRH